MRILEKNKELNRDLNAHQMADTFPRMRQDFENIARLKGMVRYLDIESRMNKRTSAGLGRRVAHLPRPVFVWLSVKFPEVLKNKQLLRSFLRNNPQYCLVEKL